ncbi:MAG: DNA alkylation repair protein [Treponema sp.]|uniref:DNA alkylation repair protein n=1 Tax=Treponema sp. TaxID=166 RepID=UPI00298DDCD6|nr:DNA alkylation repair protein [Treponema sp.]MCR5386406.1 DNA alkylation repair protein [Treponema sp.]
MNKITSSLFKMQDKKYRDFQAKLIPGKTADNMIGVRTPDLRAYAKELCNLKSDVTPSMIENFLSSVPHEYFDEYQLHSFIICEQKDFKTCIELTEKFLPFVDNWATCDQLSPKVFKKHHAELLPYIKRWLKSRHAFTVRFGLENLMQHFLDEDFNPEFLELAAATKIKKSAVPEENSQDYYVRMMVAWFFATALAKQWDAAVEYIKNHRLEPWTHNKAIQKATESYRITESKKKFLKGYKVALT